MIEEAKCSFNVVFDEVCKRDYYNLLSVPFVPTKILDVGANVGAFTSYARFLFPQAIIVAVEPDVVNYVDLLKYTSHLPNITYVQRALGIGKMWRSLISPEPPYYGCLQSYVTPNQIGFPQSQMSEPSGVAGRDGLPIYVEAPYIKSITLSNLIHEYIEPEDKFLLKLDCEGGENYIFNHELSMSALRRADLITMETHFYTKGTGEEYEADKKTITEALSSLSDTHECKFNSEDRYFWALRKATYV